jgi:penicillin-binding protein activator
MNHRPLLLALVVLSPLALAGCNTPAQYVEPTGTRTLVTLGDINIQDFSAAADTMINSLLASGVIDKAPTAPAVMGISRIVNSTTKQLDTDMLVKKIRVALNQSGKVLTSTTVGLGEAEDPLAKQLQEGSAKPYFTLSGKIIEQRAKVGDTKQVAYVFQLSLTDPRGLAVWENEKQIVKQGQRGSIGW